MRSVVGSEQDLKRVYEPSSIAVVGASSRPGTLSWWPLHHLVSRGYQGEIYPVNPGHAELEGVPCLDSVEKLPEGVDLAMISLNAEIAADAARVCADRGVGAVVMPAQGMGESGPEGRRAEGEMVAYLRSRGTRVVGPNADGVGNLGNGALATIQPLFAQGVESGRLGVVTQSGATAGSLLNRLRMEGLGCRLYASTGNEADLGLEDHLSYMLQDPSVDMVLSFVESVRRPDDFLAVAELAAELGKPIALIKVGRSEQGARRAAAHTGALAGRDAIYDAIFEASGIVRVAELSELVAVARLYLASGAPSSTGVGILSVSGGQAGAVADICAESGLTIPTIAPETVAKLDAVLTFGTGFNPCDLTGEVARDATLAPTVYDAFSREPDVGTVIYARKFLTGGAGVTAAENLKTIAGRDGRAPLVVYAMDGAVEDDEQAHYDAAGIPVFSSMHDLGVAVRGLARHRHRQRLRASASERVTEPNRELDVGSGTQDELTSMRIIAAYGLEGPASAFAADEDEAVSAAQELGYPVAVKVISPDVAHKSDVGGVVLGIESAAAVRVATRQVLENVRRHDPGAGLLGVLVAEQVEDGVEVLLGGTVDPDFGPFVLVGLGGVFAEALSDVSLRMAPVGLLEAHEMIDGLQGRDLLDGYRGALPADVDALGEAVVRLSEFLADHADVVAEVDLNPVLVRPRGAGVSVVDALVVGAEDVGQAPDQSPIATRRKTANTGDMQR